MQILGTRGRIEIQIPFNAPAGMEAVIVIDDGRDLSGSGRDVIVYRLNGKLGCIYSIDPGKQYGQWTEVPGAPGTFTHSGLLMFGSAAETPETNVYTCTDIVPVPGTVTVGVGSVFSLGGRVSLP